MRRINSFRKQCLVIAAILWVTFVVIQASVAATKIIEKDLKPRNIDSSQFKTTGSQESFQKEIDNYLGERIKVSQQAPLKIKTLNLSIKFPPNHKIAEEAKPQLKLFTLKQLIGNYSITAPKTHLAINRRIKTDKLYVDMALFYCREGQQGMCLFKNVLFEISVDKEVKEGDLELRYEVEDSSDY